MFEGLSGVVETGTLEHGEDRMMSHVIFYQIHLRFFQYQRSHRKSLSVGPVGHLVFDDLILLVRHRSTDSKLKSLTP